MGPSMCYPRARISLSTTLSMTVIPKVHYFKRLFSSSLVALYLVHVNVLISVIFIKIIFFFSLTPNTQNFTFTFNSIFFFFYRTTLLPFFSILSGHVYLHQKEIVMYTVLIGRNSAVKTKTGRLSFCVRFLWNYGDTKHGYYVKACDNRIGLYNASATPRRTTVKFKTHCEHFETDKMIEDPFGFITLLWTHCSYQRSSSYSLPSITRYLYDKYCLKTKLDSGKEGIKELIFFKIYLIFFVFFEYSNNTRCIWINIITQTKTQKRKNVKSTKKKRIYSGSRL